MTRLLTVPDFEKVSRSILLNQLFTQTAPRDSNATMLNIPSEVTAEVIVPNLILNCDETSGLAYRFERKRL